MDRSDEPQLTAPPIVPNDDSELMTRHRSQSIARARTWPLTLLCLFLLGALAAMGGYYWFDRQNWQSSQRELAGQISALSSRIANLDARGGASAETFDQQLANLDAQLEREDTRLEALEDALRSLEKSSVNQAAFDVLQRSVQSAEQQIEGLVAITDAMQRSLASLEKSGNEARAALDERIEALSSRLSDNQQRYQALTDADDTLSSRLDEMAGEIDTLQNDATQQQRWEQLSSEISGNRASLTELRQTQLAIEAAMENLRTRSK